MPVIDRLAALLGSDAVVLLPIDISADMRNDTSGFRSDDRSGFEVSGVSEEEVLVKLRWGFNSVLANRVAGEFKLRLAGSKPAFRYIINIDREDPPKRGLFKRIKVREEAEIALPTGGKATVKISRFDYGDSVSALSKLVETPGRIRGIKVFEEIRGGAVGINNLVKDLEAILRSECRGLECNANIFIDEIRGPPISASIKYDPSFFGASGRVCTENSRATARIKVQAKVCGRGARHNCG